jgi:chromosome segregation ATPase
MKRAIARVPRTAIFLAGVAAGALTRTRKRGSEFEELKRKVASLEAQIAARGTATETRFAALEGRLEEHAAKLAEIPSTSQIAQAVEQVLANAMASLDERLTAQAQSIDLLKTTVSQTDALLERVLESIDSLQNLNETAELAGTSFPRPPA